MTSSSPWPAKGGGGAGETGVARGPTPVNVSMEASALAYASGTVPGMGGSAAVAPALSSLMSPVKRMLSAARAEAESGHTVNVLRPTGAASSVGTPPPAARRTVRASRHVPMSPTSMASGSSRSIHSGRPDFVGTDGRLGGDSAASWKGRSRRRSRHRHGNPKARVRHSPIASPRMDRIDRMDGGVSPRGAAHRLVPAHNGQGAGAGAGAGSRSGPAGKPGALFSAADSAPVRGMPGAEPTTTTKSVDTTADAPARRTEPPMSPRSGLGPHGRTKPPQSPIALQALARSPPQLAPDSDRDATRLPRVEHARPRTPDRGQHGGIHPSGRRPFVGAPHWRDGASVPQEAREVAISSPQTEPASSPSRSLSAPGVHSLRGAGTALPTVAKPIASTRPTTAPPRNFQERHAQLQSLRADMMRGLREMQGKLRSSIQAERRKNNMLGLDVPGTTDGAPSSTTGVGERRVEIRPGHVRRL